MTDQPPTPPAGPQPYPPQYVPQPVPPVQPTPVQPTPFPPQQVAPRPAPVFAPQPVPTQPYVAPQQFAPQQFAPQPAPPQPFPGYVQPPAARRRPVGLIVTTSLLGVFLLVAFFVVIAFVVQLQSAESTIRDQQRELDEQRELIDKKDTFGAAMNELLDEVDAYEGVPMATLVPWDDYQRLVSQAWARRWSASGLDDSIAAVENARTELVAQREQAELEAATNASGSVYEATFDRLGSGYVTWVMEDADAFCEQDVIACVSSDDPLLVHVDTGDDALPYTNDWLRTGTAYHEFAHVLQFTNPEPTEAAVEAFGGDVETMADCFALTYLDGWTLDHTIWVSSYEYWTVSTGYGYTCDESQRQVIRDWYAQLGVHQRTLTP